MKILRFSYAIKNGLICAQSKVASMIAPPQTRCDNSSRGHSSQTRKLMVALGFALLPFAVSPLFASEPVDLVKRHSLTARSYDGRIWVMSADDSMKLVAMDWAGDVIKGVEELVGEEWRSRNRQLRIKLVNNDDERGRTQARISMSGGLVVHRLAIQNEDRLSTEECDTALCGLLLAGYVIHSEGTSLLIQNYEHLIKSGTVNAMPRWLYKGMAANLEVSRRARDSRLAHEAWQSGQIPMLGAFLDPDDGNKTERELADAYAGMLVDWIKSFPNRAETWNKIFTRLYAGEEVTAEWLTTCLPNCDSVVDLEAKWDGWMLSQKRRIFKPGLVTDEHLLRLQALLLVHPGDAGLPMSSEWNQRGDLRDMIAHRKAVWIVPFAENKKLSLRTLALGKDKNFQSVVDSYCRFLDALGGGKGQRRLGKLLDEADNKRRALRPTGAANDKITVVVPPS